MLNQASDAFTRRAIVLAAVITVSLSILGAVITMCYRAWIDGNAPLTTQITTDLTIIATAGIGSLIAALFGSNSIVAKLLEKL